MAGAVEEHVCESAEKPICTAAMAGAKSDTEEIQRLDGEMVGGSGSVLTEALVGLGLGE